MYFLQSHNLEISKSFEYVGAKADECLSRDVYVSVEEVVVGAEKETLNE